jgi:hypothetical protein
MNVEFFVKQIEMNKDKEAYLKQRLIKTYVPYEEKISSCENIIRNTSFIKDEVSGELIYKRNTPACDLFFNLVLISKYFDIDIDFEHMLADYNKLEENGYIELLLKNIPANEYVAWSKVFEMVAGDFVDNERSLVSYFDKMFGAMNNSLKSIAEIIKELPIENIQGE